MSVHLAEIGKQVCDGSHAVLVCDGAGWHQTGRRLTVPKNVTLLRLPPYSPELNPIENVWQYLRRKQAQQTRLAKLRGYRPSLLRRLELAHC